MSKRLYISIDSIFDLRMGAINTLSTLAAAEITADKKYYTRLTDDFESKNFGKLSKEDYEKLLKDYKNTVLRNSITTKIFSILVELCVLYIKQAADGPHNDLNIIDVNIYPFTLSEDEKQTLSKIIEDKLKRLYMVNIVNYNYFELNVDFVKTNYRLMIMYNYHEWLNMYTEVLKKNKMNEVMLYVPAIFFQRVPTKEEDKELQKTGMNAFEMTQKVLYPIINIEYVPVYLFSADTPFNDQE